MQVVELNRQRALLLSDLQYSSDFTKKTFSDFVAVFVEVFKLTSTMVSPELHHEIDGWVSRGTTGNNTPITRKAGLNLSEKLLDELTNLGLMQLFEEQVAPPFMLDFDLEERKEKVEAEKEAAKRALEEPVPAVEPKKKKGGK